ncbi:MAG: OstA-like protein [Bacteroidales bacterium]
MKPKISRALKIVFLYSGKLMFLGMLVVFLQFPHSGFAQQKTKVLIINARDLKIEKEVGLNINQLVGDVILRQDSTWFYCDSALHNSEKNNFDAYGNVHINVNDTLHIYGDVLNYNGTRRIAKMHHNVRMVDDKAVLTTEHLTYNRKTSVASYRTGGQIVSDTNILTSIIGHYYTRDNEFFFKDSVVLTNPDYVMRSDTLRYNTETETAYFYGPTTITGEDDFIYCERGWYDTRNDIASLKRNAYIVHVNRIMEGDSIYYDEGNAYGEAYRNITLIDTVENMIVKGNYAEFDRKAGYAFVTDSVMAILTDAYDSLYIHSDTLMILSDSAGDAESIYAYYKVKFFRKDLQGMCDSMLYYIPDSAINLMKDPVMWSEENQMSADTIVIVYANNEADSMVLKNSGFIISRDSTDSFNQIKGKTMVGYFKNNEIYKIVVSGNSQTVYFFREEGGSLIGINKVMASNMLILLENSEIVDITFIDRPDGSTSPEEEVPSDELRLKGFKWIDDRRPQNKWDIFHW